MARRAALRKPKAPASEQFDSDLQKHIESLGLKTFEAYRHWCGQHGFSRSLQKSWRQRTKEQAFASRMIADARLSQKNDQRRNPSKLIEQIFENRVAESTVDQPHLKVVCRAYQAVRRCRQLRQALQSLLVHVSNCTDLPSVSLAIPEYGRREGNSLVEGLVALAYHHAGWIRPVEQWKPRTHNARRQFSSLARHLFARWHVPTFMDCVWFKGTSPEAMRQQRWFLHLGQGENIRTADLPISFTKRMAHEFMQAPSDLCVEGAIRWGQVHALGGSERLARTIISTRLGTQFDNDDFWVTVMRWLIAHPMLDPAQVGPIIDYIHHQKYVAQEVVVGRGVLECRKVPQPNFSMKGRTPDALLRQVEVWHRQLAKTQQPVAGWPASSVEPWTFTEGSDRSGNPKVWTITELLSTKALVAEGRAMKHCVATYARSCAAGRCSIWKMEVEDEHGTQKVLTVEVNSAAKLICQARGKFNARPSDKHRLILRRWAAQSGLTVAAYV